MTSPGSGPGPYIPTNLGFVASNAAGYLTTPTYDGSGQAVHPSVIYKAAGWNSYAYWMALMPYPNDNNALEKPSLLASNDGQTWSVPVGVTNPLYDDGKQYSDPDFFMDADGTTLWYIFRENGADYDKVLAMSSTDGSTWSAPVTLVTDVLSGLLSPCILHDGSQYVMYTCQERAGIYTQRTIERRMCATLMGTWSDPVTCPVHLDLGYAWHLDVILNGAEYVAVITDRAESQNIAVSTDGIDFGNAQILFRRPDGGWDNGKVYRGSIVPTVTGFDLWYSGCTTASVWHIAYTPIADNR